ncbi:MAG: Rieske (2Fe-2S) protein [bacterium]
MPNFVKVASVQDLVPESALSVNIDENRIALFYIDGNIYAIDSDCPHTGAPLSDGEIYGCEVECPLHGARFDLATGKNLTPPADTPVQTYKVKIQDDQIYIAL